MLRGRGSGSSSRLFRLAVTTVAAVAAAPRVIASAEPFAALLRAAAAVTGGHCGFHLTQGAHDSVVSLPENQGLFNHNKISKSTHCVSLSVLYES